MAIDLEALRKKMAKLNGDYSGGVQLWKPKDNGEYVLRGLQWPAEKCSDGTPFIERFFYYIGDNRAVLSPKQFGDRDPVDDLIREMWRGSETDKEIAKKLMPRMRAYLPVVVKGEEDKGVLVWSFTRDVYNRLIELMMKYGDYLDPVEGFDIEVTIKNSGKKFNGKDVKAFSVDIARKSTSIAAWYKGDEEKASAVLKKLPNIDDMYQKTSTEQLEKMLNDWLATPDDDKDGRDDKKTEATRGKEADTTVDEALADVKSKADNKKKRSKLDDAAVDEAPAKSKKSIDDAFADLEE